LFNLISELDRDRFKPLILTLSAEDERFPSLWKSFKEIDVRIESLKLTRLSGFIKGKIELKKIINELNIDVIHINGIRGDLMVKKKDFNNQLIVTTINSNIYEDYTMLYGSIKGSIMAWLHMRSLKDKVAIGCSNFVVKELNKKYRAKLNPIYNGIPKEKYTILLGGDKIKLKKELGLPLGQPIFIFVGYLIYRKDPITTIKAFLNSGEAEKSVLLIIGDGPLMEECKQLVGQNRNVLLLGNQPETLRYLNASDYYIASSYSEGLPTSVMEAMGCGLPVILSTIEPHKELVLDIANWDYLFKINDHQMLSKKIDKILTEPYETLSAQCRSVIDDKINSQIMTQNYQELYNK